MIKFERWDQVFEYLTDFIKKQKRKYLLFFDEFQWMAVNHSNLVSLLKVYWDNHWKKQNVMLVLCGSVSSFMVKRVIKSSALYGRII